MQKCMIEIGLPKQEDLCSPLSGNINLTECVILICVWSAGI